MSGEVGHFEIPADDVARARKFYASVFGWKMNEMPGYDYTMVSTGPVGAQGRPEDVGYIGGGIAQRSATLIHPTVTIVVDDLGSAEKTIEQHGGKIVQRKTPIGEGSMGHMGYFKDSEGNLVGLYEGPKRP